MVGGNVDNLFELKYDQERVNAGIDRAIVNTKKEWNGDMNIKIHSIDVGDVILSEEEIIELVELYAGLRKLLDADGEAETLKFLYRRIYKGNGVDWFNNEECRPIHKYMSRFVPSLFDNLEKFNIMDGDESIINH